MKIQLTYGGSNAQQSDERIRWAHISYYITIVLLMSLFLWKATIGIIYYDELEQNFHKQHIFKGWEPWLAKSSIVMHILAALLLLAGIFVKKTMVYGLSVTTAILSVYTIYAQLALFNAFGFSICACIGWFEGMSWKGILSVNLLLLFVSVFSLLLTIKARRPP